MQVVGAGVKENFIFATSIFTVVVAQSVRASVCGAEGRGFEPHQPPVIETKTTPFFIYTYFY